MKAAVIETHGKVDVIKVADIPEPTPGDDEVLLEVHAAALNHLDIWVRKGGRVELKFPHVLGSDAAGVIRKLGRDVTHLRQGQEVLVHAALGCGQCEFCRAGEQSLCVSFGLVGLSRPGTFAQYVAVPARCVHPKPAHLDFRQAAALGVAYATAWRMLMTRGQLRPGQSVLIHGIGGGVATAALQFAKLAGAEVIVTSCCDDKLRKAMELGAAWGFNYKTVPDIVPPIIGVTGERGVDLVIDSVGAATFANDIRVLRKGGRAILCGVTTGDQAQIDLKAVYWNQLIIMGSTSASEEDFRAMLQAVVANKLKPVIDSTFLLEDVAKATERMEQGQQLGKIVLRIAD